MSVEIDFEGNGNNNPDNGNPPVEPKNDPKEEPKNDPSNQEPPKEEPKNDPTNPPKEEPKEEPKNEPSTPSTGELKSGDKLEIEDKVYTVDDKGNIVDDKGNVFKEAKDVAEWLKTMNIVDDNNNNNTNIEGLDISKLQEAVGITVTDEEGKPVEFTNDTDGLKSYVNSVMEIRSKEIQDATLNKLFNDNPLLKQFNDYVTVTGTARGFGEMPDRSGIKIDKENEQQQEYIIKMAAEEFGNKSVTDNYIKYLKDSNGLYNEAKACLENLVAKDKEVRANYEKQAEARRLEIEESNKKYNEDLKAVVDSGVIAGFKIPETIIKEQDGKKYTFNRQDFYNFITKPNYKDENGNPITGYQKALEIMDNKEYMERQMLDAFLLFKGATYQDLGKLTVNEDKVKTLKLKANEQGSTRTVKITPKKEGKVDPNDLLF